MADEQLEPLKISCKSTDCDRDLHSFRPPPSAIQQPVPCFACGAEPDVDLDVLRGLDPRHLEDVERMLRQEFIRQHYWTKRVDDKAQRSVARRGYRELLDGLEHHLERRIGRAATDWDGRQTPWEGRPEAYAQHATATCCRRCMNYWYGIRPDLDLNDDQLEWALANTHRYLLNRRNAFEVSPPIKDDLGD